MKCYLQSPMDYKIWSIPSKALYDWNGELQVFVLNQNVLLPNRMVSFSQNTTKNWPKSFMS